MPCVCVLYAAPHSASAAFRMAPMPQQRFKKPPTWSNAACSWWWLGAKRRMMARIGCPRRRWTRWSAACIAWCASVLVRHHLAFVIALALHTVAEAQHVVQQQAEELRLASAEACALRQQIEAQCATGQQPGGVAALNAPVGTAREGGEREDPERLQMAACELREQLQQSNARLQEMTAARARALEDLREAVQRSRTQLKGMRELKERNQRMEAEFLQQMARLQARISNMPLRAEPDLSELQQRVAKLTAAATEAEAALADKEAELSVADRRVAELEGAAERQHAALSAERERAAAVRS